LLIKYIKGVLWKVAKRLSYIWDARCLNVKKRPDTAHNTTDHYVTNSAQKQAGTSKLARRFCRG